MSWLGFITVCLKWLGKLLDWFTSKNSSPLAQANKRRKKYQKDLRDFQDTIKKARETDNPEEKKKHYDEASQKLSDVLVNIDFARRMRSKKTDPKS